MFYFCSHVKNKTRSRDIVSFPERSSLDPRHRSVEEKTTTLKRMIYNLLVAEIERLSNVVTMITERQIRAARALLGWSQQQLADKAIVSINAVTRLERGEVDPRMSTVVAVEKALQKAGIEFIPAGEKGEGVRLSKAG
jgi:ribosome-binding protein aMBF1 (putative translation factor)